MQNRLRKFGSEFVPQRATAKRPEQSSQNGPPILWVYQFLDFLCFGYGSFSATFYYFSQSVISLCNAFSR